jgi:electron transfer flavoprotein alpha subunit
MGDADHFDTDPLEEYGVDLVYCVQDPLLTAYNPDAHTAALVELVRLHSPFLVLISATANGSDLAPRLATRLRAGLVTGCVKVDLDDDLEPRFVKPTHQNKVYATIRPTSPPPYLATLLPEVIGAKSPNRDLHPQTEVWEPCLATESMRTEVVEYIEGDPRLLDVREAERIVAGGRGVEGDEGWNLVRELAELLGASLGGTRMALDMGHITQERMIGQTGKTVGPDLYIAVGISGASHHIGGVDAKCLIAINTDPDAQIFRYSDLGIVGDARQVLPALSRRLRKIQSQSEE